MEGLADTLNKLSDKLKLVMITNRGVKVWPNGFDQTFHTDHWRCRFESSEDIKAQKNDIPDLLSEAVYHGVDVIKTENLYEFDGVRGYSLGQGQ